MFVTEKMITGNPREQRSAKQASEEAVADLPRCDPPNQRIGASMHGDDGFAAGFSAVWTRCAALSRIGLAAAAKHSCCDEAQTKGGNQRS